MKTIKKLFSFFWDKSLLAFLIIGGVNTLGSTLLNFVLKNYAGWPLFFSTATAFAVFSVPAFYFNRKYSFKSNAPLGQSILRFSIIITTCFLLSFGLNNIVMPWLRVNWLTAMSDLWFSLINIIGIQVVFTMLNYLGQRLWAFKSEPLDEKTSQSQK